MSVAETYIADVLSGKQVVGELIFKAIQRQVRDLETGPARGLKFDPKAGQRPIDFIQKFCIPSGDTKPLVLLPWEQCWLYILFGWKRADGTRRFRRTLLEIAKKNGKTGLGAAILIYLLVADGEVSARVFSAATTGKSAKKCFTEAVRMVAKNPSLRKMIQKSGGINDDEQVYALFVPKTLSRLSCMSKDAATEDGAIVSGAVLDEFHHWKVGNNLHSILRYGGATRKQPILIEITTAGSSAGGTSLCWNEHEYGMKVLDREFDDDEFLPFIFSLDKDDDWEDPSNWIKSNPSLGVLIPEDVLMADYREAKGKPSSMGEYKRFRLNIWSEDVAEPAIELDAWDACCRVVDKYPDKKLLRKQSLEELKGRLCFAGLDLAPKGDTSALVLLFPPLIQGEKWRILVFVWIPKGNIQERVTADKVHYDEWERDGFLKATGGDITDVRTIAQDIVKLSKDYDIKELAYDRAFSEELIRMLGEEGFNMGKWIQHSQQATKMNSPCNEFMRKVINKELAHDADPVLRWQVANLRWKHMGEFSRPTKDRKRDRIDACVALILAISRATDPENLLKPKQKFFMVTSQDD